MKKHSENEQAVVSVVINNYNYAHFLADAIESVLAQTYRSIEIIVVDDGSTDNSREVIKSYGSRVKAIYKENGGQASAMNRGYEAASGKLIYFLDADDIALPNCVERVVEKYLSEKESISLLNFRLCLINAEGESLEQYAPSLEEQLPGRNVTRQIQQKGTYRHQPTSANVFSRRALEKIMPIPEEDFRLCAETYLCYHAPLFGEVAAIEDILGQYRIHQSNNYHKPEAIYDSSTIAAYVQKQETFYGAIEKSRRHFVGEMNLNIGGNAGLLYLIFKSANRKLSKNTYLDKKKLSSMQSLTKSFADIKDTRFSICGRRRAAVMLYLATIALLPGWMVCRLVTYTFLRSPKFVGVLLKKSFG